MTPLSKPLLQRRNTLSASFQFFLNAILLFGITYGLAMTRYGFLPNLYLLFCITLIAVMSIVYDRYAVYRSHEQLTQKSVRILKAWTITFAVLLAVAFMTKTSALFSRQLLGIFYLSGGIGQILLYAVSCYVQVKIQSNQGESAALVIGTGKLAKYLNDKINENPWMPEKVLGAISIDENVLITDSHDSHKTDNKLSVLGYLGDVIALVEKHNIRAVYIAVPLDSSPVIEKLYTELLDKNVDVHWAPNIFALNLINHSVKELAGIPLITLSESPLIGKNLYLKLILDRVLSVIVLILISPFLAFIALLIKLDSPGPVFFRQKRTGWEGEVFSIWKFRSMAAHLQDDGFIKQAIRDDPRVTKIGKFLRRSSIDELPQIFNVLAGEMSLVGPRPHAVGHNDEYAKHINAYLARHRIKPGITGLAQVRGYRGSTEDMELMVKRVESDIEYINDWSISLDIIILIRTFLFIFQKHDAY